MEYGYHGNGDPKNETWPALMPKDELIAKTSSAYAKYLNSGVEILNRNDIITHTQTIAAALNGDPNYCNPNNLFFIAENFGSDKWPELADPELAFYWFAYRDINIDDIFESGNSLLKIMCVFNEAKYLVLFGTEEQKFSAIKVMDAIADMLCSPSMSTWWFEVARYISLLAGVHPVKVFRKPQYDYSSVVNKDRAIELYKKLIDLMIADRDSMTAKYANELEPILGIQYYENKKESNASSTSGSTPSTNTNSGCCYIATCVYGSYDCPEVWTLRRFRDNFLSRYAMGRLFIRMYYAISPHIVRLWGHNEAVRKVWRIPLEKLVSTLNAKGVEDTPYED